MSKKRLNIAIFHCGFVYSGGGERIVLEEARGLIERGYKVSLYVPTIDKKLCYPKLIKELNAKMFLPSFIDYLPFRDALRMVATSVLAPLLAYKFRHVDIFFAANQPSAWIAWRMSKVLKKPYLVYLNQPNRLIYPRSIDKKTGWQNRKDYYLLASLIRLIKPFIAWADKKSFSSAQAMLVNGSYIAGFIKKIYQKDLVLCPGGAHPQPKLKLLLKTNDIYKGLISINKHRIKKPYLLIANRHEPQKRFDYVIKAFAKTQQKYPQAQLVIPGPYTSYTKELLDLVKKLKLENKIIFPGQVKEQDLQRLFQSAAIHCYPAPDEDFGLGPLEAAAWALPTVAWNKAGMTVTILDNKTGLLAKPYQIDDYASKILVLLRNPDKRMKMGEKAWQHLQAHFSWQKHIEILENSILSITNKWPN